MVIFVAIFWYCRSNIANRSFMQFLCNDVLLYLQTGNSRNQLSAFGRLSGCVEFRETLYYLANMINDWFTVA